MSTKKYNISFQSQLAYKLPLLDLFNKNLSLKLLQQTKSLGQNKNKILHTQKFF